MKDLKSVNSIQLHIHTRFTNTQFEKNNLCIKQSQRRSDIVYDYVNEFF